MSEEKKHVPFLVPFSVIPLAEEKMQMLEDILRRQEEERKEKSKVERLENLR